jgi:hypothetical protein
MVTAEIKKLAKKHEDRIQHTKVEATELLDNERRLKPFELVQCKCALLCDNNVLKTPDAGTHRWA